MKQHCSLFALLLLPAVAGGALSDAGRAEKPAPAEAAAIGILIVLLLPAVQKVRDATNRIVWTAGSNFLLADGWVHFFDYGSGTMLTRWRRGSAAR